MSPLARAAVGFGVAPLIPAAIFAVVTPLVSTWPARLGMVAVGYFYAAAVMTVFAVPTFILLFRRQLVRWWSAVATGFLTGALAAMALRGSAPFHYPTVLLLGAAGALAGLVFWLIWRVGLSQSTSSTPRLG